MLFFGRFVVEFVGIDLLEIGKGNGFEKRKIGRVYGGYVGKRMGRLYVWIEIELGKSIVVGEG